jgi:hypothetical protein
MLFYNFFSFAILEERRYDQLLSAARDNPNLHDGDFIGSGKDGVIEELQLKDEQQNQIMEYDDKHKILNA